MKRYIRSVYLLSTAAILVIFAVVCVLTFAINQRRTTELHLKTVIQAASETNLLSTGDYLPWARGIATTDGMLRITIIRPDGSVTYDTDSASTDMRNQDLMGEITQAKISEFGVSFRKSSATGVETLFVAKQMEDGSILRLGYPMHAVYTLLYILAAVGAILLVIMTGFVFFIANRMSKRLLGPLRDIDDLLAGMEMDHALSSDFPESAPLINNIRARIEKLAGDMVEIQRTQQMRSDFVENASHELKSPLTSIKGFAELLGSGMVTDKQQQEDYLGRIVSESDRLLYIIEDILHLSMAERGPSDDLSDIDMRATTASVFRSLRPQADKKKISLEVAGNTAVRANAREMFEMIYNLVDNAIRYGKMGGHVKIRIDERTMTVVDDGVGITAEESQRIFERFYRVEKSHSRQEVGGTGLGLSIVKHIAQKYGGNIEVESTPDEGSTFTISLW